MPGDPRSLDGTQLVTWGERCVEALHRHRDEINALNVFPVADADTGTNLLTTMRAAVDGARGSAGAHEVLRAMARAGTAGARGNSGIILSQLLRGLAEAVPEGEMTAARLRDGLRRSAVLVREALSVPVRGTMLTVLEAAADSAADCVEPELAAVARAAADGAAKALDETPEHLDALRAAGVVDAGARGLLVLLDALVVVAGAGAPVRPEYQGPAQRRRGDRARRTPGQACDVVPVAGPVPEFEVMYRVGEATPADIDVLRESLAALGDSVVVVGDGAGGWSAHVHCADAGAAVEAGLAAGRPSAIRIESLVVHPPAAGDRGVLALTAGTGAARLFEDAGAVVLDGPATADDLLAAIRRMPHHEVLVLPNGAIPAQELVAVAAAARAGRREVLMLPSGSVPQGLAALAVHDAGRLTVEDAVAMAEAAAGTRSGAVRVATERALTIVGTCAPGDGLGLVGDDVVVIDVDVRRAARTLLSRMLDLGGELVTLLVGADAPPGFGAELAAHVEAGFPGVEVACYTGGQRVDLVQIGVE
ncbi:DAK2 domain-containing protein [Nocardia stercoris]|uniref:DAK2 domain-containing protein n=1 Tax=Nocardia stercoris TaxID=2483361 RepID=UPI001F1FC2B8|nr:DAK2 domain-containing protein [Nocardia stercoris]